MLLARHLEAFQPTLVVSSQEPKAIETGEILAQAVGIPWKTAENLHEHERLDAHFLQSHAEFQQAVIRLFRQPDELVFGRETASQARKRFEAAIGVVLVAHPWERIALVAHGTIITLLLCHHNPTLDAVSFWQSMTSPCSFTISLPDFTLRARQDIDR